MICGEILSVGSIIKSFFFHLYTIPMLSNNSNSGLRPLTITGLFSSLNVSLVCCKSAKVEYVIISLTHSVNVTLYACLQFLCISPDIMSSF